MTEDLRTLIADFARRRDWERFHTPRNLALAIVGEIGELAAELQWIEDDDSQALDAEVLRRLEDELADVAIYLIRLADVLGIDIDQAVRSKMARNEHRFPAPPTSPESRQS